jgi:homoserine acetyltransferase
MAITYLNNISLDDNQLKNFLIDKKTTTQRDAMTAAAGHAIYNTTVSKFQFYDGTNWLNLQDELEVEEVQDIVGGMLGGTETGGITVTYDDPNNHIDFALDSITNFSY